MVGLSPTKTAKLLEPLVTDTTFNLDKTDEALIGTLVDAAFDAANPFPQTGENQTIESPNDPDTGPTTGSAAQQEGRQVESIAQGPTPSGRAAVNLVAGDTIELLEVIQIPELVGRFVQEAALETKEELQFGRLELALRPKQRPAALEVQSVRRRIERWLTRTKR